MTNPKDQLFRWKSISVRQDPHVFKIGTDALLLGSWIPGIMKKSSSILDVGTGTGIIALMLGNSDSLAHIDAIDIDQNAVKLAGENFRSGFAENIKVYCEDLFAIKSIRHKLYDSVVCNPPYFADGCNLKPAQLSIAKHLIHSPGEWIKALTGRIKPGGELFLVLPYSFSNDWILCANELEYYCRHRLNIYSFDSDASPKRSLLQFTSHLEKPIVRQLSIYDKLGSYTEEYLALSCIDQYDECIPISI